MTIAAIESHIQDASSRLLSQFVGRPNLTALINLIAAQVQRFENAAGQMPDVCFLANAQGAQLDGLGEIVGEPRSGMPDALYALFLRGKIAANTSKADHETLLGLTRSLFESASAAVRGDFPLGGAPLYAPAALGIEVGAPTLSPSLYGAAIALIRQAMAAGVALAWVVTHADDDAFAFAANTSGQGFASNDGTTQGGQLAQIIYNNFEA